MKSPLKSRGDPIVDKARYEAHRRKLILNRIRRNGLSPSVLGFPSDYEKQPLLALNKPRTVRRPKQWPYSKGEAGFSRKHPSITQAEYLAEVREWKKGKICVVMSTLHQTTMFATQCHHIYGKQGKLLLWKQGWLPVSEVGHKWIHENPEEARKRGWLCSEQQWNDDRIVADE